MSQGGEGECRSWKRPLDRGGSDFDEDATEMDAVVVVAGILKSDEVAFSFPLIDPAVDTRDFRNGSLKASFRRRTLMPPIPGQLESSSDVAFEMFANDYRGNC